MVLDGSEDLVFRAALSAIQMLTFLGSMTPFIDPDYMVYMLNL